MFNKKNIKKTDEDESVKWDASLPNIIQLN